MPHTIYDPIALYTCIPIFVLRFHGTKPKIRIQKFHFRSCTVFPPILFLLGYVAGSGFWDSVDEKIWSVCLLVWTAFFSSHNNNRKRRRWWANDGCRNDTMVCVCVQKRHSVTGTPPRGKQGNNVQPPKTTLARDICTPTHTHTHTLSLSHTHTHSHTHSLSYTHTVGGLID